MKKIEMKKNLFLIIGGILLILNIMFIGLLKYNEQNLAELFIKHKPSLVLNFSSENNTLEKGQIYKEFITDYNIEDKTKSFFPLILIQLMLTSFVLSINKLDLKRKLALFAFHFVICLIGLFQLIDLALNQTKEFITILILLGVIIAEFAIMKLFTK
jgi:hypothetical protein